MNEALIVGVDPGSTSAVAAVNLDGEMKLLESQREMPPREIIMRLVETGKPVVVACDTEKMPSTVEKIASSLGAAKFVPEEDLDVGRKKQLGDGTNSHERDAMASAIHAHKNLQRNIRKIEKISSEEMKDKDKVAAEYFSENTEAVKQRF